MSMRPFSGRSRPGHMGEFRPRSLLLFPNLLAQIEHLAGLRASGPCRTHREALKELRRRWRAFGFGPIDRPAKFAADLGDLSVKLVTPGVAVVLWNGAVQKADQVSDIAFGERGPWDLKVFRTAIHPGAVPPKCGGEREDAEKSAGRAKCRPISGAFGAGTMASTATALDKQGCARRWRSGRLEVANTGEESEKIRDLPAVKLRSRNVPDFRCAPHLGGVVPHLAGKLHDAARQLPFTAKFRPDPASLPVQRVADDAGLTLKNFPAPIRTGGKQFGLPPWSAADLADVGQQVVHFSALEFRPRNAKLLHPHLHLRCMIPHGLCPDDRRVNAFDRRKVRTNRGFRRRPSVTARATLGRE